MFEHQFIAFIIIINNPFTFWCLIFSIVFRSSFWVCVSWCEMFLRRRRISGCRLGVSLMEEWCDRLRPSPSGRLVFEQLLGALVGRADSRLVRGCLWEGSGYTGHGVVRTEETVIEYLEGRFSNDVGTNVGMIHWWFNNYDNKCHIMIIWFVVKWLAIAGIHERNKEMIMCNRQWKERIRITQIAAG